MTNLRQKFPSFLSFLRRWALEVDAKVDSGPWTDRAGPSPGPPTTSPTCPTVATMPFPDMTNMPTIHPDRDMPNCNMPALALAPVAIS